MKKKKLLLTLIIVLILLIGEILLIANKNDLKEKNNQSTTTTTKKIENEKEINLTFVGDLLFESPFYNAISNGYDKNTYFNRVKKYFLDDDISVGNMEVVIGNNSLKVSGDGYNFCAPPYIGDLVSTLDFEVLGTSNNHANDRGIPGMISTIDYFKNNTNIKTIGTNKSNEKEEVIIEVNGLKVGFLSYAYGTNIKVSKENYKHIEFFRDQNTKEFSDEYKKKLMSEISNLKSKTDILVVLMHWGKEFTFNENEEQRNLAKFLNEQGVDIIMGAHSHSIQPIDIIGSTHKTLVYYSMGNFTSQDDDIARTPLGQETFDNAYQFGILSKVKITVKDNLVNFKEIKTIPIINYFDKNLNNFELIPYNEYTEEYEKSHLRYKLGLTKDFINKTFNDVIDKKYQ